MKILVTGASGFIGGRFASHALDRGMRVRISGRREGAVEHLVRRGAEFIGADLTDADMALRLCHDVEAVVHCAGLANPWGRRQDLERGTALITENIVEGCLKQRVRRLVHLSCASVYVGARSTVAIGEAQLPRRSRGTLAASKRLAEEKVFGAAEFGLQTVVLRPATVVGAGDHHLLPKLVGLQARNRLAIVGNGLNTVDFTSVHNLVDALYSSVLADDQALGRAYNIGNDSPLPVWDVINYVMRQLQLPQVRRYRGYNAAMGRATFAELGCLMWPGRPEPRLTRMMVKALHRNFTLDIGRAQQHLDYQPQVSLWAALDEFCAWWRASHPTV